MRLQTPGNEVPLEAILRQDFYSFVQATFPIVSPGAAMLGNWHLEALTHVLDEVRKGTIKRLIITVPPRSLKSICASVALPAFILGHDPTKRIICVSYSDHLARKHANDCRALMKHPRYRRIFPGTQISPRKDTELELTTTKGGSRLTTSVGGTLTGRGGSLVIIDDPIKPQDAFSDIARDNLIQWYGHTLLSRLDNKANDAIIIVMQRVHVDDLVGHVLEQGGWHHLDLPAIADVEQLIPLGGGRIHHRKIGDLLHPEREPLEELEKLKREMGSASFSAQYQQQPVPAGGNLIKWNWFKRYDHLPPTKADDRIIMSWDTATSGRELADFSACVVLYVQDERVFILDVVRERLEYPDLRRRVMEVRGRWHDIAPASALVIENKGSGMSLIQDLKRDGIYPLAHDPDRDKAIRMAAETPRIESGSVFLPNQAGWMDDFRLELMAFPQGRHDDQVDAFSQGLFYIREMARRRSYTRPVLGHY